MLLVQKLTAMDFMRNMFQGDVPVRDWFSGIFRHKEMKEVQTRFLNGEPISVFQLPGDSDTTFHAAFNAGTHDLISYVTMTATQGDMFAQEIGLHFCRFSMEKELGETVVKTIQKSQLGSAITYGLMLPYVPKHISFQRQYTVVFWDWEVLLCDNNSSSKGLPSIDADVYSVEYLGLLDVLRQV